MFRKGQKVRVNSENDNDNYDSFRDKVLVITGVYKNDTEHHGYDMGLYPERLYEFETIDGEEVPCALYEYEIEKA